ncbi:hypothetical protein ACLKA7_017223 [Drosophila subpalustris]
MGGHRVLQTGRKLKKEKERAAMCRHNWMLVPNPNHTPFTFTSRQKSQEVEEEEEEEEEEEKTPAYN